MQDTGSEPAIAGHRPLLSRADNPLVRAVGRVPTTVQRKLLVAFVGIAVLLVIDGVLGLRVLSESNDRVETLGKLQQRATAYRQLQTDATQIPLLLSLRLASVDSNATFVPTITAGGFATVPNNLGVSAVDGAIGSTLNDLNAFVDVDRPGFAPPPDERSLLANIHSEYGQLSAVLAKIIANDVAGKTTDSQQLQVVTAGPRASDLKGSANQLVSLTKAETASLIDQNRSAYLDSQHLFIGVAAGSIALALLLGFIFSWSLIGPIKRVNIRLAATASGDFSGHLDIPNRDELGTLAANLNRMNGELGRLYKEVETASRHKSEFLANMSHELRTPLNAIIGFSQVLQDQLFGELNAKQKDYLDDILSSGQHLLSLINDILDLAKVEAGSMDLQLAVFPMSAVLETAMAMVRERATRQRVALISDIDPSVNLIDADERKVKQILFNLLSNAVKFTHENGRVTLAAKAVGDCLEISVSDTGVGIGAEDRLRIFEEFYQVTTGKTQEGTGLGLPLTKRLVELHGGVLEVKSSPGAGSTFTFTLPIRRQDDAAMDATVASKVAVSAK